MRYVIPTFFIILVLLVLQSWFADLQKASPAKEAVAFLSDLSAGDLSKIVRHFGSNVCQCPKKKGWGAYLAYQTDEEPNLAFLIGHPFTIGEIGTKLIKSPPQSRHGVPWEYPEDYLVDVQLSFDKIKYSPLFLPLPLAYGKPMSWQEIKDFEKNPSTDWSKSFSLRLRSSLNKGAINLDTSTIEPDVRGEFKFITLPKNNSQGASWYLAPKDPGAVMSADGKEVSIDRLSTTLPHLHAVTIQLRVVHSGKLQPWTVSRFELLNPILERSNRLINLSNSQ